MIPFTTAVSVLYVQLKSCVVVGIGMQEALGRLPYLVALDAEQRAVVLAVRGTSSLSDALTDAIAHPCDLLAGWLGRAAQAR